MRMRDLGHIPLAALMLGVGVLHFTKAEFFLPLMPPALPWHGQLVALSGAVELTCAVMLLVPAWRTWGAWLTFATLLAVWPANWHHALAGGIAHPDLPVEMANAWVAWVRLPLQLPLLWWAWTIARREQPGAQPSGSVLGMPVGSQPH